jgi:hypothetical protein
MTELVMTLLAITVVRGRIARPLLLPPAAAPIAGGKVSGRRRRPRRRNMIIVPLDLALVPRVVLPPLAIEGIRAPRVQPVVEALGVIAHVAVVSLLRPVALSAASGGCAASPAAAPVAAARLG